MLSRIWWRGLTRRWGSSGATAAHVPELGELKTMARGKLRLLNLLTSHLEALERDDDPALRELNLSKNRIGAEGAAALAHAMMTRQKRQHPITIKGLEEAFHHGTHNEL